MSSPKSLKNSSSSFASLSKVSCAVLLSASKRTSKGSSSSISSTFAGAERALDKGFSKFTAVAVGFVDASNSLPKASLAKASLPSSNVNPFAEYDLVTICGEKASSASANPPVNGSGASEVDV